MIWLMTKLVLSIFLLMVLQQDFVTQVDQTDKHCGSLSTVVGDEKLTSRENLIGFLFLYVQSDEDTLLKVDKVS